MQYTWKKEIFIVIFPWVKQTLVKEKYKKNLRLPPKSCPIPLVVILQIMTKCLGRCLSYSVGGYHMLSATQRNFAVIFLSSPQLTKCFSNWEGITFHCKSSPLCHWSSEMFENNPLWLKVDCWQINLATDFFKGPSEDFLLLLFLCLLTSGKRLRKQCRSG